MKKFKANAILPLRLDSAAKMSLWNCGIGQEKMELMTLNFCWIPLIMM